MAKKKKKKIETLRDVKSFSDYWKLKGDMIKEDGVSKMKTYTIWCDCLRALEENYHFIKK